MSDKTNQLFQAGLVMHQNHIGENIFYILLFRNHNL